VKEPRVHTHGGAAVHAVDLIANGRIGLGGPYPLHDVLPRGRVIDIPNDAVGSHSRLPQRTIGGQEPHIARELTIVVR